MPEAPSNFEFNRNSSIEVKRVRLMLPLWDVLLKETHFEMNDDVPSPEASTNAYSVAIASEEACALWLNDRYQETMSCEPSDRGGYLKQLKNLPLYLKRAREIIEQGE